MSLLLSRSDIAREPGVCSHHKTPEVGPSVLHFFITDRVQDGRQTLISEAHHDCTPTARAAL